MSLAAPLPRAAGECLRGLLRAVWSPSLVGRCTGGGCAARGRGRPLSPRDSNRCMVTPPVPPRRLQSCPRVPVPHTLNSSVRLVGRRQSSHAKQRAGKRWTRLRDGCWGAVRLLAGCGVPSAPPPLHLSTQVRLLRCHCDGAAITHTPASRRCQTRVAARQQRWVGGCRGQLPCQRTG